MEFTVSGVQSQEYIFSHDTTKIPEVKIGEVPISASKSNLSLKKMPISVTLLSGNSIESNEINNLTDISSAVPNLFMPDYGSKLTSPVYIRGVGSRINSPSVGLYVDNVPFFEKASFNFDFFDIKAIEVLRGPQGTLYGRNTMGGLINIITPSPMEKQGGKISLNLGSYGFLNAGGGYYGKIGDNFGYSLSLNYLHKDGFYLNNYTDKMVDNSNSYGLRNRLIWNVSDRFSIENIVNAEKSDQGGYPYAVIDPSTEKVNDIDYNQYSFYNRKILSDAIVMKYTNNSFEVVSTSSFQYLDDLQVIDQDFTVDSLYYVDQEQKQNMFSQEIIIRSTTDSKYDWLFGVYGFMQGFDRGVDVDVYASNMSLYKEYDHKVSGYAFFHQSTIDDLLIKNLTLTAGIRFDFERDVLNYIYDRRLGANTSNLADTTYPELNGFEVLPKVALSYSLGNNTIYATIARGYKTGGFNSTFEREEDLMFNPEYSWNYEAGAKTSLFGKRVYADMALFYIDMTDQQIYQTVPSGRGSMLKNAGSSVSKGIEVTLKAIPLYGFENSLTYGYTRAQFTDHVVNDNTDYTDNFIPYVPRYTFTFQTNKTHELRESFPIQRVRFNILFRGMGMTYWKEDNQHYQGAYGIADFKVTFTRGIFDLDFWIKNILGSSYESFYFTALGNEYVQMGKPRHMGVRLSANF